MIPKQRYFLHIWQLITQHSSIQRIRVKKKIKLMKTVFPKEFNINLDINLKKYTFNYLRN